MKDNIERIELRIGEVIPGIPQTNLMRIRLVNCAEVTVDKDKIAKITFHSQDNNQ